MCGSLYASTIPKSFSVRQDDLNINVTQFSVRKKIAPYSAISLNIFYDQS